MPSKLWRRTLARAHARSGDPRCSLATWEKRSFRRRSCSFAMAYAAQTKHDMRACRRPRHKGRPWPKYLLQSAARYAAQDLRADLAAGLASPRRLPPNGDRTSCRLSTRHGFHRVCGCNDGFVPSEPIISLWPARINHRPDFRRRPRRSGGCRKPEYFSLCASFALLSEPFFSAAAYSARLDRRPRVKAGHNRVFAGIACHIVISQLPSLLGIPDFPRQPVAPSLHDRGEAWRDQSRSLFWAQRLRRDSWCGMDQSAHSGSLLGIMARPSRSIGLGLSATALRFWGPFLAISSFQFHWCDSTSSFKRRLAFVVVATIMVQTAATTREFPRRPKMAPPINLDLPVLAQQTCWQLLRRLIPSMPAALTGIVAETGGRSKFAGWRLSLLSLPSLVTARASRACAASGARGILLFVAMRIVRAGEIITIFQRAIGEFMLIVATVTAIIVLPWEQASRSASCFRC